jgi:drug/metabolite transporter (DMT)-like permease
VPVLALLGLLGVFANQVLYILGLAHSTASNAAILMLSIPVFTAAVAAAARVERFSARKAAGVALAVAGALVLLQPGRLELARGGALGNLLLLVNCLAYAAYLVLQRPALKVLPPLTLVAWAFLFGAVGVLAVSAPQLVALRTAQMPLAAWSGIAYIVLVPTVVNYALNTWALRRSSPALVATYTTLQPVVAALLAVLFLGERVGIAEMLGFALIAAGVAGVARAGRP